MIAPFDILAPITFSGISPISKQPGVRGTYNGVLAGTSAFFCWTGIFFFKNPSCLWPTPNVGFFLGLGTLSTTGAGVVTYGAGDFAACFTGAPVFFLWANNCLTLLLGYCSDSFYWLEAAWAAFSCSSICLSIRDCSSSILRYSSRICIFCWASLAKCSSISDL